MNIKETLDSLEDKKIELLTTAGIVYTGTLYYAQHDHVVIKTDIEDAVYVNIMHIVAFRES